MKRKNIYIIVAGVVVAAILVGAGIWAAAKTGGAEQKAAPAPSSTSTSVPPPGAPIIDSDKLPTSSAAPSTPSQTVSIPRSVERQTSKMSQQQLDQIFEAMMKDKKFENMPYLVSLRDDLCSNLADSDSGVDVINSLQDHTGWDDDKVGFFVGAALSTRCPDMDGKVTK